MSLAKCGGHNHTGSARDELLFYGNQLESFESACEEAIESSECQEVVKNIQGQIKLLDAAIRSISGGAAELASWGKQVNDVKQQIKVLESIIDDDMKKIENIEVECLALKGEVSGSPAAACNEARAELKAKEAEIKALGKKQHIDAVKLAGLLSKRDNLASEKKAWDQVERALSMQ